MRLGVFMESGWTHHTNVLPHTPEEGLDVIHRGGMNERAIIKDQAYPEVVHQDGEERHNEHNASGTSKLESVPERTVRDRQVKGSGTRTLYAGPTSGLFFVLRP